MPLTGIRQFVVGRGIGGDGTPDAAARARATAHHLRLAARRRLDVRYWAGEASRFRGRKRRFERWMARYHRRAERRVAVLAELEAWGLDL